MGKVVDGINGDVKGDLDEKVGGRAGERTDSNSTSTTSAGSGDVGGRDGGRAGGNTKGDEAEKVVSQVVTVDTGSDEERKREERNAKRRERYARQKAESGQTVKPRKVNQKKKEQTEPLFDREQLNNLIVSLSAVVASRPNCEQWLLSQAEVDAITKPLCNIISESGKLELITQNSNQIALGVACVSVFAPRLMVTVQKAKEEKEKKNNVRKAEQAKADTQKLNRERNERNADNGSRTDTGEHFLGVPLG